MRIISRLGKPNYVEGPYSWWSLRDEPEAEALSSLYFDYDEGLNVLKVRLRENRAPQLEPIALELQSYRDETAERRHRMNLELVRLSSQGRLPAELKTIRDVERFFPMARFAEEWYYRTGLWDAIVVSFDSSGMSREVLLDF